MKISSYRFFSFPSFILGLVMVTILLPGCQQCPTINQAVLVEIDLPEFLIEKAQRRISQNQKEMIENQLSTCDRSDPKICIEKVVYDQNFSSLYIQEGESSSQAANRLKDEYEAALQDIKPLLEKRLSNIHAACPELELRSNGYQCSYFKNDTSSQHKWLGNLEHIYFLPTISLNQIPKVLEGIESAMLQDSSSWKEQLMSEREKTQQAVLRSYSDLTDSEQNSAQQDIKLAETEELERFIAEHPFLSMFNLFIPLDPQRPIVGYSTRQNMKDINMILDRYRHVYPDSIAFMWALKPSAQSTNGDDEYELVAVHPPGATPLTSAMVESATTSLSESNFYSALFEFNEEGTKMWSDFTGKYTGHSVAIVWRNRVLIHPHINEKITEGQCVITGEFTREEIDEIVLILESGRYPAPVRIVTLDPIDIEP